MTRSFLLAIAMAAGCAEPSVVTCADGRLCPLGTLCVADGCAAPGCGDGDVDSFFGEQCDDGNQRVGDGCSPDCKFELCGNAILDESAGEECDDGNLMSHDGCSSACLSESMRWHQLVGAADSPVARRAAAVAWDPDRGQAVLHGGSGIASNLDEVWIFDGRWRPGPAGPPATAYHGLAWDGGDALLLFGDMADPCWIWRGSWARCTGSTPTRRTARLATRPGGGVVMLGGPGTAARETWLWDGMSWTPGPMGPANPGAVMVEDRSKARVVLVGGTTWVFDTAWRELAAEFPRFGFPLAYNGDRRLVVAYGGADSGGISQGDVHELVDERWQEFPAADAPIAREDPASFYDPIRRGLVVLGGASITQDAATWILRWESATPDESCVDAAVDADGDGLAGCDDPDCWGRCDPRNPPGITDGDPDRPRCGDGVCNPALETGASCPKDCS